MTSTVRVRPRGPDRRALRSTAIAFVSTIVVFGGSWVRTSLFFRRDIAELSMLGHPQRLGDA